MGCGGGSGVSWGKNWGVLGGDFGVFGGERWTETEVGWIRWRKVDRKLCLIE